MSSNFRLDTGTFPIFGLGRDNDRPRGSIRRAYVMMGALVAMIVAWFVAVSYFSEWRANWWNISIFLIGVVIIGVVGFITYHLGDYVAENHDGRMPNWLIWSVTGFFVLSMFLGTFCTEAATNGGIPRTAQAQGQSNQTRDDDSFRYSRTGWIYYYWFYAGSSSRASSSGEDTSPSMSCSGKSCDGYAVVILIAIALALLLLSVFVPHFWVIATLLAIVLFLAFTWREFAEAKRAGP